MFINDFCDSFKLKECSWGFAGESYIQYSYETWQTYHLIVKEFPYLNTLFYTQPDTILNRTQIYYSTSLSENITILLNTGLVYEQIREFYADSFIKRYFCFTCIQYSLTAVGKIIDASFAITWKTDMRIILRDYILQLCDIMVSVMFGTELVPLKTNEHIIVQLKAIKEQKVRFNIEMDNILIILLDYAVNQEYITRYDTYISLSLGGVLISPFYVALEKHFCCKNTNRFSFMKFSYYDNSEMENKSIDNDAFLSEESDLGNATLIIDDNIGTGKTLRDAKCYLTDRFGINPKIKAVECHWERFFRDDSKIESFSIKDLDILSPFLYRHYTLLEKYIINTIFNHNISERYFPECFIGLSILNDLFKANYPVEYKKMIALYHKNNYIRRELCI